MKKSFVVARLLLLTFGLLLLSGVDAAEKKHKIALSFSSSDLSVEKRIFTNLENIVHYYGKDNLQIEVVAYGPGLQLVTKKSSFPEEMKTWLKEPYVRFSACGNTMNTIEKATGKRPVLIDGVVEVEGGILRLIDLQEEGYVYLTP